MENFCEAVRPGTDPPEPQPQGQALIPAEAERDVTITSVGFRPLLNGDKDVAEITTIRDFRHVLTWAEVTHSQQTEHPACAEQTR